MFLISFGRNLLRPLLRFLKTANWKLNDRDGGPWDRYVETRVAKITGQ